MRNVLLVLAVWALLWGAAEILGVMPQVAWIHGAPDERSAAIEATREARPHEPGETTSGEPLEDRAEDRIDDRPEPPTGSQPPPTAASSDDATIAFVGPLQDPARSPDEGDAAEELDSEGPEEVEGSPLCAAGDTPRLHAVNLPAGSPALLVDCGGAAELLVPRAGEREATLVARLTFSGPLKRVEAIDLTGDGRPDLALAFENRLVLLPTTPHGVWGAPTTLEGFTGGADGDERPKPGKRGAREAETKIPLEGGVFSLRERDDRFFLAVERAAGEGELLQVTRAALVYEAHLH